MRVRSVDREPMRSADSLAKLSGGATLNPHLMDESPPMSALSAQRIYERALYVVAPATTAAVMVLFRSGEADQALVVLAALIASSLLLWPSGMPMHLMPIAGNALRLFAPVAGTALVLAPGAISAEWPLDPRDMAGPLVGALLIVVLARFLERRFDTGAPVRLALIGSRHLAIKLADELRANGISGYRVVGYITPDEVEPEPQPDPRRGRREHPVARGAG